LARGDAARKYQAKRRRDPKYRAQMRAYLKMYRKKHRARLDAANAERQRRLSVEIRLQRKGLDPKTYAARVKQHHGRCDICGGPPDGRWKRLNIDHCHKTGCFRGLLCFACNRALGYFKDDPKLLRKAAYYLMQHRKTIPGETDILGSRT